LIVAVIGAGKIGEAVADSIANSPKVNKVIVTKRNVSTLSKKKAKFVITTDNRDAAKKGT